MNEVIQDLILRIEIFINNMSSQARAALIYNNSPACHTQKILDLIAEGEADVVKIDEEIARAQAVVDQLIAKKLSRLDQICAYRAALCPAQRLPAELVTELLILARESWDSAFALSQICRRWRQISINTPRLWRELEISVQSWTFDDKMSLLKMFCERVSGFHLSVTITTKSDGDDYFDGENLVQVLTPYFKKITSLRLFLPDDCFLAFAHVPEDSFPRLESFMFSSYLSDDFDLTMSIPHIISFSSANRLSHFNYCGDLPMSTALQLPEQLNELYLENITSYQCVQVLQHVPNLTILEVTIAGFEDIYDPPDNQAIPMLLSGLHELELEVEDTADISNIIDYITAPCLQSFRLDGWTENRDHRSWSETSSFYSFITRSACSLTWLSFKGLIIPTEELIDCLSVVPSLLKLDLDDVPSLDDFVLDQLVYRPSREVNLLPKLSVFNVRTLKKQTQFLYHHQMFLEVVISRWRPDVPRPSRLSRCRLYLENCLASQEHLRVQVGKLRREGLDIKITFSDGDFGDQVRVSRKCLVDSPSYLFSSTERFRFRFLRMIVSMYHLVIKRTRKIH